MTGVVVVEPSAKDVNHAAKLNVVLYTAEPCMPIGYIVGYHSDV